MYCATCGSFIKDGFKFCGACGGAIQQPTPETTSELTEAPSPEQAPPEQATVELTEVSPEIISSFPDPTETSLNEHNAEACEKSADLNSPITSESNSDEFKRAQSAFAVPAPIYAPPNYAQPQFQPKRKEKVDFGKGALAFCVVVIAVLSLIAGTSIGLYVNEKARNASGHNRSNTNYSNTNYENR